MSTSSDSNDLWWLRKVSEHGLGHLLSPLGPKDRSKRWQYEGWEWVTGRRDPPPWFELPAISQISVSSPHVLRAFEGFNAGRSPEDQIRPFNFCLSAHVAPFGHPEGVDPLRFHLIGPFSDNPELYLTLDWFDRFSGDAFSVTTTDDSGRSGAVLLQTYGDVFGRYARHPESKSLDALGWPGRWSGLLGRRPVQEGSRSYVGKESNLIEEVGMASWQRLDEVMAEYGKAHDPWSAWVVPVLRRIPLRILAEQSGLHSRTLQRLRNGRSRPHRANELRLVALTGAWAREELRSLGRPTPRSDVLACRTLVETQD
jgi:hypothetical protein